MMGEAPKHKTSQTSRHYNDKEDCDMRAFTFRKQQNSKEN